MRSYVETALTPKEERLRLPEIVKVVEPGEVHVLSVSVIIFVLNVTTHYAARVPPNAGLIWKFINQINFS